jgi:5-methylcytosine-specific restriction protein B
VALADLRGLFESGLSGLFFDPARIHDAWGDEFSVPIGPVRTVVFHASYSYEEFVLGLVPKPADSGGVDVEPRPGPLLSLAHWASTPGNAALLIVDEFNRGNAAGIFGDVLGLLDKDKRADAAKGLAGATLDRAYSGMEIHVGAELATDVGDTIPDKITLPASLWVVAALNSSDRSVAPIDAALRRRFSILPVGPDYSTLAEHYGVELTQSFSAAADPATWTAQDTLQLAIHLLMALNNRIALVLGEDFLLGHGLFWDVSGQDAEAAVLSLSAAFDERVAASLRMTFADQDEPLAAILGAGPVPAVDAGSSVPPTDALAYWVVPPSELDLVAVPRLRMSLAQTLDWTSAARAFRALL